MRKIIALVIAVSLMAITAGIAVANSATISERETRAGVEQVVIDDEINQASVYIDGKLTETRPATDRELEALKRQVAGEQKKQAIDDLRSSVADLKGRPLVDVNSRLARIEATLIELAEALGIE